MRFLAAVASLAVSASALLIVPELSKVEIDSITTAPPGALPHSVQTIYLECPDCLVNMDHGHKATTNLESYLQMKFEIDHEDNSRLLLNGIEIYPHADLFKPLKAPHFIDTPNREGFMRGGMVNSDHSKALGSVDVLGFSLFSTTTGAHALKHITVDIKVFKVRNKVFNNIPSVHVNLVKDRKGRLAITEINTSGPQGVAAHASNVAEEKANCHSWLCNLIGSLESHWSHWRPHCAMGSGNRPHHHSHHGKGPHQRPHQTAVSGVRTSHHPWHHATWSVGSHIILPVLVAGFTMSIIGLVIGTLIIFARRRVMRSPCSLIRCNVDGEAVSAEEKDGLMEHQEPPPSYEEASPVREGHAGTKF